MTVARGLITGVRSDCVIVVLIDVTSRLRLDVSAVVIHLKVVGVTITYVTGV